MTTRVAALFLLSLFATVPALPACTDGPEGPDPGAAPDRKQESSLTPKLCGDLDPDCAPEVLYRDQGYPVSISLTCDRVLWANWVDGYASQIMSAPKSGGDAQVLSSPEQFVSGVVGGNHCQAYWSSFGNEVFDPTGTDGFVATTDAYGGEPRTVLAGDPAGGGSESDPFRIALGASEGLQGHRIYWPDYTEGRVRMYDLVKKRVTSVSDDEPGATAVAADEHGVAWVAYENDYEAYWDILQHIRYLDRSRKEPVTLAIDPNADTSAAFAIALTPKYVFWVSNNYPGEVGHLYRVDRDRPGTMVHLASWQGSAVALTVDMKHVYWVVQESSVDASGSILRTPIGGGSTVRLAKDQNVPYGIVDDDKHVYWLNQGLYPDEPTGGEIVRVKKSR